MRISIAMAPPWEVNRSGVVSLLCFVVIINTGNRRGFYDSQAFDIIIHGEECCALHTHLRAHSRRPCLWPNAAH